METSKCGAVKGKECDHGNVVRYGFNLGSLLYSVVVV